MSSKSYDNELKSIRDEVQKAERTRVQLETKKEESLKRKAEYEKRCEELGVKPGEISNELVRMENEIEKLVEQIRQSLPAGTAAGTDDDDDGPAF
ncbi:hypothetical protein D3C85_454880 [compost metagenome]